MSRGPNARWAPFVLLLSLLTSRADDVLLLLPKEFDAIATRAWSKTKHGGYSESDLSGARQKAMLHFRGNTVTAGDNVTDTHPIQDGGVVIINNQTRMEATYDKGRLSGTWESHQRNWNKGSKHCNDEEYMQVHYRGVVTGQANADGVLTITVQMTEDSILDREYTYRTEGEGKGARTVMIYGGGWKKRAQEPNLYTWGADFPLPVGQLQPPLQTDAGAADGTQVSGAQQGGGGSPATAIGLNDIAPIAMGTGVVGALTALGAGIMMLGMGVTPRDVIDGARELFGGASPEATTMEPLTQEQRGAAARILAEGWQDVSSQEQELIRTSPEWLRNGLLEKLPAETIKGYEPSLWREGITAGLKAAQSYIDAAVGIYSSATGNGVMAVHYTYWKNMLGGTSEGVADWVWGNNTRGLVLNVGEGFVRGSIKAGVETAVDLAAGTAISNPVAEYVAGQAGKYAVGAAGDAAVDWISPPGSKDRMLRAEGFFDTTSPVEKDVMDALLEPETWATSPARPAPRLSYMAQGLDR